MTSFYRFLLLRIEEASEKSEWGCQESKNTRLGVFLIGFLMLSSVRKLGVENTHRFADSRTFYFD